MWEYLFDSEWKQRTDIEALRAVQTKSGSHIRRRAKELEKRVEWLEHEVGELALLCRSLLTLLREGGVVDRDTGQLPGELFFARVIFGRRPYADGVVLHRCVSPGCGRSAARIVA